MTNYWELAEWVRWWRRDFLGPDEGIENFLKAANGLEVLAKMLDQPKPEQLSIRTEVHCQLPGKQ